MRLRRSPLALAAPALAALAFAAPCAAGAVTGRVSVTEKGGRPATDLTDVVVFVEGAKPKAGAKPAGATVVMKGKQFSPRLVVVPVGGTVVFPNEDPIFHNAFSVSGENRFDLALYKRPRSGTWTFQKPGVVKVYCNIHPQMSGVVMVVDSAHWVRAGADGSFTLDGVPPGKHTVKAWHERGGESAAEVTVPATGTATAVFALDAAAYKRAQHKNKFGKDYSSDEKY